MSKNEMTIGVDIDGVLTDFERFVLDYGKSYFEDKRNMLIVNHNGFDVDEVFGATPQQLWDFWKRYCVKYCLLEPARKGAKETLARLKGQGHRIVIITGRMMSYKKGFLGLLMRLSVRLWLWKSGIRYNEIIFCPEHDPKIELCKKLSVDLIIEDKPKNVAALSKAIKVICFEASYNRDCEGENIARVRDWGEVYGVIG